MKLGMEVGLGPSYIMLDEDPAPPPRRSMHSPLPIFGLCLLWPNGWLDQDVTWYGGGPRPRPHCVRWGPSSPSPKGAQPPNFRPMSIVAKRLEGSRSTWYGGRPRSRPHCVRWGPRSPSPKAAQHPQFWAHIYVAKRSHISATDEYLFFLICSIEA